ncbi:translation initiation factor III [Edwardsiella tarda]|uniref:Translation initiation factor III n=1 Tax=Edwardsiella tarda TaxID=636 RepID=A0A2A7U281_EDWTA|nr:translation initiation factor III [Edwardsiella tarda]PEH72391.1 translation initiation factor III [Edwardsiella tarda]
MLVVVPVLLESSSELAMATPATTAVTTPTATIVLVPIAAEPAPTPAAVPLVDALPVAVEVPAAMAQGDKAKAVASTKAIFFISTTPC